MSSPDHGLVVHRHSRTERLAAELASRLDAARPADPLAPQTVVVAHPGLKRWLLDVFARRRADGRGIAANFEMILPWQWLDRAAALALGEGDLVGGAYRRESLRWRVYAALTTLDAPEIERFLSGPERERRRFQFAEHMAGVFEQYLIYRADWVLAWERGARGDWQAELWRSVQAAVGLPHRAQRSRMLVEALAAGAAAAAPPLHLFGPSHLAPDVLAALAAFARRQSVHVYFPDPCREHWVYFASERQQLKAAADAQAYFEIGHPLLAGLGRIAQDFCIALEEFETETGLDEREEAEPLCAPQTLLAALQESIRVAEPGLVGAALRTHVENMPDAADDTALERELLALRSDASLRIHACHTRLRELEVLRDALLGFLAADPTLSYREIVVMAPDIASYAPYLPAVFGEAARHAADATQIPWHLADVALARSHPLLGAFGGVLDLAESRFAVSEVLDFLDVPAVARRFRLDADARTSLEAALRRARVAWGLDAAMREQAGAAPVVANTWEFGLDRLFAGMVAGDEGATFVDGILPAPGVTGAVAEAVGQLDALLGELRSIRAGFGRERTLADWTGWLLARIDALFLADPADAVEETALDALRRAVVAPLRAQPADLAASTVPWSVMREAVRGALGEISERQPYLLGAVTFCGLVPQRSIPFRAVCLIGMNEGEFPRAGGESGLNRMIAEPRRGDRDTRSDDRYLFLEAIMAARGRLHISYIGENVTDGTARNPAAPLADLLKFLDEQHAIADAPALPRPWFVRHPLQPFDARYFLRENDVGRDGTPRRDERLFSYAAAFASRDVARPPPFLEMAAAEPDSAESAEIALAELTRFWRDPAKGALRDAAGVSLAALDGDSLPDREPLDTRLDRRERVERRLLLDALIAGTEIPASPPPWLEASGLLAAGAVGRRAYAQARDRASTLLAAARDVLGKRIARAPRAVDLELGGGLRLSGVLERAFRGEDGALCLFDARPTGAAEFRELVPFYLELAACRLAEVAPVAAHFVEIAAKGASVRVPPLLAPMLAQSFAELRDGLRNLVAIYRRAQTQPVIFPLRTAWAFAASEPERRLTRARAAWEGGFGTKGERDYEPSYAALLQRGADPLDPGAPAHAGFVAAVVRVARTLDPHADVLLRDASEARRRSGAGA